MAVNSYSSILFYGSFESLFIVRYEVGRWDASSWMRWNNNLQRIAARPENTIAANNLYDLVRKVNTVLIIHTYTYTVMLPIAFLITSLIPNDVVIGIHEVLHGAKEYHTSPQFLRVCQRDLLVPLTS